MTMLPAGLNDPSVLGGLLNGVCEASGLSLAELASDLGVPFTTLQRVASGDFFPTMQHVRLVAEAVGEPDLLAQWWNGAAIVPDRLVELVEVLRGHLEASQEVMTEMSYWESEITARIHSVCGGVIPSD